MLAGMFGKLFGIPSGQPVHRRARLAARRAAGRRALLHLEGLEDRLALSPFMVQNNILVVTGTPGNDYFTYSYTPSTQTAVLTLNGASYTVDEDHVFLTDITFDGQGGSDTAVLNAAKDALDIDLRPGTGHLFEAGGAVEVDLSNTENIYAYGNSATRAMLYGDNAGDTFTGTPTAGYQYGAGYYDLVSGAGYVYADAFDRGSSSAYLYGSAAGGDTFSSDGFYNKLTFASGNVLDVRNFAHVYASSGLYGSGTASFADATGQATLNAAPEQASIVIPSVDPRMPGFTIEADGFRRLTAKEQSAGGTSAATFTGSGDDTFSGGKGSSALSAPGYYLSAVGFTNVTAYGTGDATEHASLFDSAGDDTFVATPNLAEMFNGSYAVVVHGFKNVYGAHSAGGNDTASLYDSPGNDTLTAGPTSATLSGTGFSLQASGFATLHAYAKAGGHDVASLTGGPGGNTFTAYSNTGHLAGTGFDVYVTGFAAVDLFSAPGGAGAAYIGPYTLSYLLTLHPGWIRV
jgi:hypothetical protein